MATVEQAYNRYLIKVEKNAVNDNISTDRGRFVELFNESQVKFEEQGLQNRGVDDVRYLEKFLINEKPISYSSETLTHFNFPLPTNYLDLAEVRATGKKEKCKYVLYLFEAETENLSELLQDADNKPSFKWQESFYTVNSDVISVYKDDFQIPEILLSYYRYPNQISLINPYDPESGFDESKTIEWDEKSLNRIISMCAGEFDINENDPRFQAQLLRTQK